MNDELLRGQAIEEYHRTLAADPCATSELLERLREGMRRGHLLYGDRPIGVSLRPHLLTRRQYSSLVYASETLVGAYEKISTALTKRPELMDVVGMSARLRKLALVDPGYKCPAVTTRLDAFISGGEVRFVEYNAENPSSLPDQAALNDLLSDVDAMRLLAGRYNLTEFDPVGALLESLLETFREWGGHGAPNIAILDWEGVPTHHEFALLRERFEEGGAPTLICDPGDLEYDGSALRCGDFRIDLVYKRVVINELLERFDETHPLLSAYMDGRVCMVNSFRCKPLQKKASFELLTDETYEDWYTRAELEVIRSCVPWTRRIYGRRTLRWGREVDLIEHVRRERESFVLKPNDDYGGRGVCFGDRVGQDEWEQKIGEAIEDDYVVQERIKLSAEEFPVFGESEWGLQHMFVDTNPFLFRGKVCGAMVRLSDTPLVNVSSGGGEAGFFVIEGSSQ